MSLSTLRPRLRHLTGLLAVLAFLAGASPAGLGAQVPVEDEQNQKKSGTELFMRVAEFYAVAKEWRGEMVTKARAMMRETRQVMALRRKYEYMATGELGKLGEQVPQWSDLGNVCSVDVAGHNLCHAPDSLRSQYEGVLENNFEEITRTVFEEKARIEGEISGLIGQQLSSGPDRLAELLADASLDQVAQSPPFIRQRAEESGELSDVSRDLNLVVDSVLIHELKDCAAGGSMPADSIDISECEGREISSGRAQQLAAYLIYTEARVELELARSKLRAIRQGAVRGAEQVGENRQRLFARRLTDRW